MFPGLQGSPLLHAVAAKAVCLGEALRPEFKDYAKRVLENARALADALIAGGLSLVSGGTDTPLMLVDLRPLELTGDAASASLERAGLTANKNAVPFDPKPPTVTSGLRLGSSAGTDAGFREGGVQADRGDHRRGLEGFADVAGRQWCRRSPPRSPASAALSRSFPIYTA